MLRLLLYVPPTLGSLWWINGLVRAFIPAHAPVRHVMNRFHFEGKPFIPYLYVFCFLALWFGYDTEIRFVGLLCALYALMWPWLKDVLDHSDEDDDEDRWKRRRRSIGKKVEVVDGKLVVSPAPTS